MFNLFNWKAYPNLSGVKSNLNVMKLKYKLARGHSMAKSLIWHATRLGVYILNWASFPRQWIITVRIKKYVFVSAATKTSWWYSCTTVLTWCHHTAANTEQLEKQNEISLSGLSIRVRGSSPSMPGYPRRTQSHSPNCSGHPPGRRPGRRDTGISNPGSRFPGFGSSWWTFCKRTGAERPRHPGSEATRPTGSAPAELIHMVVGGEIMAPY